MSSYIAPPLLVYNANFGEAAQKCSPSCSWSGNNVTGQQPSSCLFTFLIKSLVFNFSLTTCIDCEITGQYITKNITKNITHHKLSINCPSSELQKRVNLAKFISQSCCVNKQFLLQACNCELKIS